MFGFCVKVTHDFEDGPRQLTPMTDRLSLKMREGVKESARLASERLVASTLSRTKISPETANRIVQSNLTDTPTGGRASIGYTSPPPGGWTIRPKNKKALFWPGMRSSSGGPAHPVKVVRHPGSRPFSLVPRTADTVEGPAREIIERKIEEVLESG